MPVNTWQHCTGKAKWTIQMIGRQVANKTVQLKWAERCTLIYYILVTGDSVYIFTVQGHSRSPIFLQKSKAHNVIYCWWPKLNISRFLRYRAMRNRIISNQWRGSSSNFGVKLVIKSSGTALLSCNNRAIPASVVLSQYTVTLRRSPTGNVSRIHVTRGTVGQLSRPVGVILWFFWLLFRLLFVCFILFYVNICCI